MNYKPLHIVVNLTVFDNDQVEKHFSKGVIIEKDQEVNENHPGFGYGGKEYLQRQLVKQLTRTIEMTIMQEMVKLGIWEEAYR